jgi:hypothetical protein
LRNMMEEALKVWMKHARGWSTHTRFSVSGRSAESRSQLWQWTKRSHHNHWNDQCCLRYFSVVDTIRTYEGMVGSEVPEHCVSHIARKQIHSSG